MLDCGALRTPRAQSRRTTRAPPVSRHGVLGRERSSRATGARPDLAIVTSPLQSRGLGAARGESDRAVRPAVVPALGDEQPRRGRGLRDCYSGEGAVCRSRVSPADFVRDAQDRAREVRHPRTRRGHPLRGDSMAGRGRTVRCLPRDSYSPRRSCARDSFHRDALAERAVASKRCRHFRSHRGAEYRPIPRRSFAPKASSSEERADTVASASVLAARLQAPERQGPVPRSRMRSPWRTGGRSSRRKGVRLPSRISDVSSATNAAATSPDHALLDHASSGSATVDAAVTAYVLAAGPAMS